MVEIVSGDIQPGQQVAIDQNAQNASHGGSGSTSGPRMNMPRRL